MLVFYNWLLICVLVLLAGWGELMLNTMHVFAPVFVVMVFYLFVVNAWWRVLLPVTVMAVLMDTAHGRMPVLTLMLAAVAYFLARFWLRYGSRRRYLPLLIPGAVIGGSSWILAQLFEAFYQGGWRALISMDIMFVGVLRAIVFGGGGCVLCVRLADALANRCEMPTFIRTIQ